jgi:hypothetical protein
MKIVLEILLSIFLHPIAAILMIVNVVGRDDLNLVQKIVWSVLGIVGWGVVPVLYCVVGGGSLW